MIHAHFSLPHVEGHSCRMLWSAVLISVLRDLCAGGYRSRERRDAERWVGDFPTKDFKTVCQLADLDPSQVHEWLSGLIPLSIDERRNNAAARLGCKPTQIGNALMVRQQRVVDTDPQTDIASHAGQGPETSSATVISLTQRRDKGAGMIEGGMSPTGMPDALADEGIRVPMNTVWNDLPHLRKKGRIDCTRPPASTPPSNQTPPSAHSEEEHA